MTVISTYHPARTGLYSGQRQTAFPASNSEDCFIPRCQFSGSTIVWHDFLGEKVAIPKKTANKSRFVKQVACFVPGKKLPYRSNGFYIGNRQFLVACHGLNIDQNNIESLPNSSKFRILVNDEAASLVFADPSVDLAIIQVGPNAPLPSKCVVLPERTPPSSRLFIVGNHFFTNQSHCIPVIRRKKISGPVFMKLYNYCDLDIAGNLVHLESQIINQKKFNTGSLSGSPVFDALGQLAGCFVRQKEIEQEAQGILYMVDLSTIRNFLKRANQAQKKEATRLLTLSS